MLNVNQLPFEIQRNPLSLVKANLNLDMRARILLLKLIDKWISILFFFLLKISATCIRNILYIAQYSYGLHVRVNAPRARTTWSAHVEGAFWHIKATCHRSSVSQSPGRVMRRKRLYTVLCLTHTHAWAVFKLNYHFFFTLLHFFFCNASLSCKRKPCAEEGHRFSLKTRFFSVYLFTLYTKRGEKELTVIVMPH